MLKSDFFLDIETHRIQPQGELKMEPLQFCAVNCHHY